MRFAILLGLLLLPALGQARVFSYKDSGVAAYIRGTSGLSQLDQDAFANSSGGGITVDGSSSYNYGGEVGIMFGFSANVHMRIGAEVMQEHPVVGNGVNSAGVPQFSLNSSVFIFNPNLALEYVFASDGGGMRFYAEGGAGYATVNVTNAYTMTAAGTTNFGIGSFSENFGGATISGMLGLGLEDLFTDNVTFMADFGYRYLPLSSMKYSAAVNNIVKPAGEAAGAPVLNMDSSTRKLNLSGFFAGVAFRFYLNFF